MVTVPVSRGGETQWLHDRVAIPAKIAKAVYIPSINTASAYLTENAAGVAWQSISIAQLRELSGIDAFPALPEPVKQAAVQLPEPAAHSHGSPRSDASPGASNSQVAVTQYQRPGLNAAAVLLLKSLMR